jgi:hypothetical protein
MANIFFNEKRYFARFPINIPASCSLENTICAKTEDISAEGMSLLTDMALPEGSEVGINLHMYDTGEKIYRRGKVVWVKLLDVGKYRIGIRIEGERIKTIPLVLRAVNFRYKV